MHKYLIGIDIGGTSIKIGIVSIDGELVYKWSIPTKKDSNGFQIIPAICYSLSETLKKLKVNKDNVIGIGSGIPGFVDTKNGMVYEAVNIGWKNVHYKQKVEKLTNLPVFLENDANTAVLGENWKGAGNEAKHIIVITLGTGVGGGIISNGKLLNGHNGMAGELGHIQVEENGVLCNCGKYGCLETIASATGIVRQVMEKIDEYPNSTLAHVYEANRSITSEDVFRLAERGEKLATAIVKYTADKLGSTFADLGVILNPEKILIGGGVSQAGQFFIEAIVTEFKKNALPRVKEACEIKRAQLGNNAGIIGAAFLVKQNIESVSF